MTTSKKAFDKKKYLLSIEEIRSYTKSLEATTFGKAKLSIKTQSIRKMFTMHLTIEQKHCKEVKQTNIFKSYRANHVFKIFEDLTFKSEKLYIYSSVEYPNLNTLEKVRLLLTFA